MVRCSKGPRTPSIGTELKESDNRFTSPSFIEAVEDSLGSIDFDPCWHPASSVRPLAHLDVRRGDDGLSDAWSGDVVFVNPPWSQQKRWIERAHDQWSRGLVKTVVCLVPAKTDTKFFHDVLTKDADIYFIEGRPRFSKEDGTSEATMVSVMVVMFGADPEQKARFAERVRGSWWQPLRTTPVFAAQTPVRMLRYASVYVETSCVGQRLRGGPVVVYCSPNAE